MTKDDWLDALDHLEFEAKELKEIAAYLVFEDFEDDIDIGKGINNLPYQIEHLDNEASSLWKIIQGIRQRISAGVPA